MNYKTSDNEPNVWLYWINFKIKMFQLLTYLKNKVCNDYDWPPKNVSKDYKLNAFIKLLFLSFCQSIRMIYICISFISLKQMQLVYMYIVQ